MIEDIMGNHNKLIRQHIEKSIETKRTLLSEDTLDKIGQIGSQLGKIVKEGRKILFCGNGGSAADAQHLAAELVIRLRADYERPAIPALALTVDPSIMTAGGNDIGFDNVFARSVEAYGQQGDALIGISTSGKSRNVINAVLQAKKQGMITIGLLGKDGGDLGSLCDIALIVNSSNTAHIQESHITIGHIICQMIEEIAYPK